MGKNDNKKKQIISHLKIKLNTTYQINKIDLENKRVISKEKAMEFAKSQNIDYIETSSKTGENIDKTIKMITEKVIQKADSVSNFSFALDSGSFNKRKFHSCC